MTIEMLSVLLSFNPVLCNFAVGQEIDINGTACADTVCRCRTRDGFVPFDGTLFCRQVPECVEGEEMLPDGMSLSADE